MTAERILRLAGRDVRVTNLDKVMFPVTGTTKADVIDYYTRIAPVMIAHCAQRPATRKRWVHGVGTAEEPGPVFFQKNLEAQAPAWVARTVIEHRDHANTYPLVNDVATLIWLAQIAALEVHVPQWRVGPDGPANPDRMVLDLDPGPGAGLAECVHVAVWCREILDGMGLAPIPVTSGSKGIHLYAHLDGVATSAQVSGVAHELARALEADHPDLVVSDMKRALREGKVFIDWSQNSGNKTTIAPYSLRGRERPMVAAPRSWAELAEPGLAHVDMARTLALVAERGDPLAVVDAPLAAGREASTPRRRGASRGDDDDDDGGSARVGGRAETARAAGGPDDDSGGEDGCGHVGAGGEDGSAGGDIGGLLATYRARRDPARTPEPFGEGAGAVAARVTGVTGVTGVSGGTGATGVTGERKGSAPDSAPSFVIQEHHARALHFDLRLERDGVLVSWALPKGVPADPSRNHLAVHVEDHPLDYGSFEGRIPTGEYGAGSVSIWDAGTYELEKWRPEQEIIVMLHGRPDGGLARLLAGGGGESGGLGTNPVVSANPDTTANPNTSANPNTGASPSLSPDPDSDPGPPPGFPIALIHTGEGKNWLLHRMKPHRKARLRKTWPRKPVSTVRSAGKQAQTDVVRPPRLRPMLATQAPDPPPDLTAPGWAFEMKWDGMRALLDVTGAGTPEARVRIWTRNGIEVTNTYPDLACVADRVHVPAILDGEIVALDERGRPDFGLLQERFGLTGSAEVVRAVRRVPVDLMLFDVLMADGRDLIGQTYDVRREVLGTILEPGRRIHVPDAFDADPGKALEVSRAWGLEGVMAKERDSTYLPGQRSRAWLKLKHVLHQEVVVVGWRPGAGARAGRIGSLLVAVAQADGGLRYVGRVGTGLSDRALAALGRAVGPQIPGPPSVRDIPVDVGRDAVWVAPDVVGEVQFSQWTAQGRLRHPVWRGLRADKP